ncbi:tetratricopeptide repeat protein [Streptomyces sp. NPDC002644]
MDRITVDTPKDARNWDERDWDERVTAAWARLDAYPPTDEGAERFRESIGTLAGELPDDHPYGLFERACAWDSTGRSDLAVPLYRRALDGGLDGYKGRRARIQLASSLRNVGRAEEGLALLEPELTAPSDELDDAVRCVLALCLSSLGRDREGLSLVLEAMAAHLPRYQRSMAAYARVLRDG